MARPAVAFRAVAAACAGLAVVVAEVGAPGLPKVAALAAAAYIAVACLGLAWSLGPAPGPARRIVHHLVFATIGAATAAPFWFFGPLSGFVGIVGLALILLGMASGPRGALPAVTGWLTCAAIAAAYGAVFWLVVAGVLPDRSIEPIGLPHVGVSAQTTYAMSVQVMLVLFFLVGRATQGRYEALAKDVDESVRASTIRQALLDEARADYKRALAAGRRGVELGRELGDLRVPERAPVVDGDGATPTLQLADEPTAGETLLGVRHRQRPAPARHEDLAAAIHARGPISHREVRGLLDAAVAGLAALHARGAPHLEVRPATIVRDGDAWTLLDVAAATMLGAAGPPSPDHVRYMAPERIAAAFADVRADVYGVAATIYAALTGTPPYAEIADGDVARAVATDMPCDPGLGQPLDLVLRIGMARAPGDRYPSVDALRAAVRAALDGTVADADVARGAALPPWRWRPGTSASIAPTPPSPALGDDAPTTTIAPRPAQPPRRRRSASSRSEAWRDAHRAKMREFSLGMMGFNAVITPWFCYVVASPVALAIALVGIVGQASAALLHYLMIRRRDVQWPWVIIAVMTVVPAYSLGLGSAAMVPNTSLLFAGTLFRTEKQTWRDRLQIVGPMIATHVLIATLVIAGVIPDLGNSPVLRDGASLAEIAGMQAFIVAIMLAAVGAGQVVDARYDALQREREVIARQAAATEAQLASARAELDAVLAQERSGIFSGLRVGDYKLGRLLGRGGMGEVYEAATAAGARVALKLVRGDRVADARSLRLFGEEADVLGRVRSPYVARVLAAGDIADELPFLAMEFIDGPTLSDILRDRRRLAPDEVAAVVRDIARGLADVHASGVLHLDLKPQNVIRADGRWKLVDFGVSRLAAGADRPWIMGTPSYMAPEQAIGGAVDARSDLYSLTTIAYRALTGRAPFVGERPSQIARAAQSDRPPDPRALATLPDDVVAVLRIGLAARPEDRFASAHELEAAFAAALTGTLPPALRRRAARLPAWLAEPRPALGGPGLTLATSSPA
jgi:serine/threonine-protein kinase